MGMESPSGENSPAEVVSHAGNHAVPEAAVRDELERLLAGQCLRDSDLLRRFLRYVVEHTLAGEGDKLKEYRLGLEVFGRDDSFDPRIDPVVRMAARRLRGKLQECYDNGNVQSGVRIEVPKGGYAARFVVVCPQSASDASAERRVEQRVTEPAEAAAGFWRRGAAAAAALAAGLLIAGGFYYHSRLPKRLTNQDTVVLADFSNSTGDPVFDDTLKTALSISLQQSPFLSVLSDEKATATLQTMLRPAGTKLTSEVTRELCQRAGSKAYIAGAIASLGNEYVVGLKAINCQSGDTLVQEQVTAASKENVLDGLGKAASSLRAKLGESLPSVRKFDVPLAEATTSSLEALKAYSLGQEVMREKSSEAALPFDLRAIELDPNFALAHFEVGSDYMALNQLGRARDYLAKAFELRQHASEREKLAITAAYYRLVTGEIDKAVKIHQQAIESYPREYLAYVRLGVDFAFEGQYEKAAMVTRQSVALDPDHSVAHGNLAEYALALQHPEESGQIVHQALARKLDSILFHNALYALGFLESDSAAMLAQQEWYSGTPQETYGLALASDTEAYSGHVGKARELGKQALDSAQRADSKEMGAVWLENGALRDAAYGYAAEARQAAAAGLKLAPESQVKAEAALALAMGGDTARAESLARELNQRFPLDTQMQSLWLPAIKAQLAMNRKKPLAALEVLQVSSSIELGLIPFTNNLSCLYPTYVRAEAYLAAGQGQAAASEFQRIIDHSGIVWNCWTGALAHLGLARANALQARTSQGEEGGSVRVRALSAYKDFLTLWKDADPGIPILKEARAEYAKLKPIAVPQ
jgi:tetratricopeptide (TPR) repeat protein